MSAIKIKAKNVEDLVIPNKGYDTNPGNNDTSADAGFLSRRGDKADTKPYVPSVATADRPNRV